MTADYTPPAPQPPAPADQGKGDAVERLTKAGTLLGLVLCVAGLLTVNSYLRYLGISDFSLLKPRYIYIGGWLGLTVVIGLFVWQVAVRPARVRRVFRKAPDQAISRKQGVFYAAGILVSGALLYWVAIGLYGSLPRILVIEDALVLTGLCLVSCGALFWLATIVAPLKRLRDATWLMLAVGLVALVAFAFYIRAFAVVLYPIIPEQFGGGKSDEIQLLLGDQQVAAQYAGLSLPFVGGQQGLTVPVRVLFEADDAYILGVPDRLTAATAQRKAPDFLSQFQFDQVTNGFRVIQVEKKDVKGLIVPGEPAAAGPDLALASDQISVDPGPPSVVHFTAKTRDACTTLYSLAGLQQATNMISVRVFGTRPAHANCNGSDQSTYQSDQPLEDTVQQATKEGEYTLRLFTAKPEVTDHCLQGAITLPAPRRSRRGRQRLSTSASRFPRWSQPHLSCRRRRQRPPARHDLPSTCMGRCTSPACPRLLCPALRRRRPPNRTRRSSKRPRDTLPPIREGTGLAAENDRSKQDAVTTASGAAEERLLYVARVRATGAASPAPHAIYGRVYEPELIPLPPESIAPDLPPGQVHVRALDQLVLALAG
jgi:hypothetical protein